MIIRAEHVRAYLYRVALILQPMLGALGVAKHSDTYVIGSMIVAVLSVSLAVVNTSTVRSSDQ
jgi:hypothetical protein